MFEVQMRGKANWVFVFIRKRVLTMTTRDVTEEFLQVSGVIRGSREQRGQFETSNMKSETSPLY